MDDDISYIFPADIHVLIICALQLERDAVLEVFAHNNIEKLQYIPPKVFVPDQNCFKVGALNVLVITCGLGGYDSTHAAAMAEFNFINLKFTILCGVCGGIPQRKDRDIFIGDVVIGTDVVLFDFGSKHAGGQFKVKEKPTRPRSQSLEELLLYIQHGPGNERLKKLWTSRYRRGLPLRFNPTYDPLYKSDYIHAHRSIECSECLTSPTGQCLSANGLSCSAAGCESQYLEGRTMPEVPNVVFGRIGCSNSVVKDAMYRNARQEHHDLSALEMEGFGVLMALPDTLVVKGVCDYADSHKEKTFQGATAQHSAAVALSILEVFQETRPTFFARKKPLYQLPAAVPHAVVRRDDMVRKIGSTINAYEFHEPESLRVLISGLSGSGKTQLVREFALAYFPEKPNYAVYYIDCTSFSTFKKSMTPLADHFDLEAHPLSEVAHLFELRRLLEQPSSEHYWLMILDNVKDETFLEPADELEGRSVLEFIPQSPQGTIMWISTTSSVGRAVNAPEYSVHTTPEEASLMFQTISGVSSDVYVQDLVLELGLLPSAICHAAEQIKHSEEPVKKYVDKLRSSLDEYVGLVREVPTGSESTLFDNLLASVKRHISTVPQSRHLFYILACLSPSKITHELLESLFTKILHSEQKAEPAAQLFYQILGSIADSQFISRKDRDTISEDDSGRDVLCINPLLHKVLLFMFQSLDAETQELYMTAVLELVEVSFVAKSQLVDRNISIVKQHLEDSIDIASHVIHVCQIATTVVTEPIPGLYDTAFRVLDHIYSFAVFSSAYPLAISAVELQLKLPPYSHSTRQKLNMAMALFRSAQYAEAIAICRENLADTSADFNLQDLSKVRLFSFEAAAERCSDMSRVKEVDDLLKKWKSLDGCTSEVVLECWDALLYMYRQESDMETAKSVAFERHQAKVAAFGPYHRACVEALCDLAVIERQHGDLQSSHKHLKEALDIARNTIAEEIFEAEPLFQTSKLLAEEKQILEAESLCSKAADLYTKYYGAHNLNTSSAVHYLADLRDKIRKSKESENAMKRDFSNVTTSLGSRHSKTQTYVECLQAIKI